jgi:hypothetical protein
MTFPVATIPERHKRPGVCYAVTIDGIELPVIDLTHPAFGGLPDQAALDRATRDYLEMVASQERMPPPIRRAMMWLLSRRSRLVRAVRETGGSYLSGLDTYMVKLGPENLGAGYANRIDRAVASGLPSVSARFRLRNAASLIAEALVPALEARPGAVLRMVNIAGGPAMDSVNALLFVRRDYPGLLEGRTVRIRVLDVDEAGPAFGARALEALTATGAPLAGLQATIEHCRYDWTDCESLRGCCGDLDDAVVACSSEGGLFEYGNDAVVTANLEALRRLVTAGTRLAGSVTKEGPLTRTLDRARLPRVTYPRTLESFTAVAARGGWEIDRAIENLMTWDVRLRPMPVS